MSRCSNARNELKPAVDIYISLGSNIDPAHHLASARDELLEWLDEGQLSPVYQSPPVGMSGADFLNAVVAGYTNTPLQEVVDKLLEIELAHGRIRTANKFSDRTIDLDLLIYGSQTCEPESSGDIALPHPEILEQAYVLQPLADVAGELVHPAYGRSVNELRHQLQADAPEKFEALSVVTIGR